MNDRPSVGHNKPPEPVEPTEFFDLLSDIETHLETSTRWLKERPKIESKEVADACSGHIAQLRKLATRAKDLKAVEKKPHLDANKAIEERYKEIGRKLDIAMDRLKLRLQPFLVRLEREQKEAAEKAAAEAAERQREADEAARRAESAAADPSRSDDPIGDQLAAQDAADAARAASKAAKKIAGTKAGVGKQYGRSTGLVEHWSAELTEPDRAVWHFRKHPKVLEVVQALATAAVRADHDIKIDGVNNIMEKKPR